MATRTSDPIHLIPFREQLEEYPGIKELLLTPPKNLPVPISPAWWVYGKRTDQSKWGRREFETYKEAFSYVKPRLREYHDISITCKRKAFLPPGRLVRIKRGGQPVMVKTPTGMRQKTKLVPIQPPPGHLWCMYCRRFTIFTWFHTHHALRGEQAYLMDPTVRRCCICGVRETAGAHNA